MRFRKNAKFYEKVFDKIKEDEKTMVVIVQEIRIRDLFISGIINPHLFRPGTPFIAHQIHSITRVLKHFDPLQAADGFSRSLMHSWENCGFITNKYDCFFLQKTCLTFASCPILHYLTCSPVPMPKINFRSF